MRRTVLATLILVHASIGIAFAQTPAGSLAWDPNSESDLAGYYVSYGTTSGQYFSTVDVGNVAVYELSALDPTVPHYFALRAYNTSGAISEYSAEVSTTAVSLLRVTGLSSNRTSPQPVGTSITFTAIASGGTAPYQYKWWIDNGSTSVVGRTWSTDAQFSWTPASAGANYTIRVWARNAASTADAPDNAAASLAMTFAINTATVPNQRPTVNAGADQTISRPGSASLSATVADDGLPASPGAVTLTWKKVSGTGAVTFSAPGAKVTTASFNKAGTFVLRLTASDGALSASDDVTVTVNRK